MAWHKTMATMEKEKEQKNGNVVLHKWSKS